METSASAQLFAVLASAKTILIATHENPDGDALASAGLVYELCTADGKQAQLFCKDAPDKNFSFLPHIEKICSDKNKLVLADVDAVAVLDCANLKRTGIADEIKNLKLPILNIDHHRSNDNFGDVNIVDGDAVSTTEILYELLKTKKEAITKSMATCILTGILTDSGNFAYTATNTQTFEVASEMLTRGANVRGIIAYTQKNKRLPTLKIWGLALSRLRYSPRYDIAVTMLTQADLKRFSVAKEDLEGLSNFLNTLKDAKIILVLYELPDGRVKGSLRTTREGVDVCQLAQAFGGGGHTKAAGFEVEGKLEQTKSGWMVK
jgi:phosphoesterase RecJ-like protein